MSLSPPGWHSIGHPGMALSCVAPASQRSAGGDVAAALRQAVWHLGFCVCLGEWGGSQVGCLSNKWIGVDDSESFD